MLVPLVIYGAGNPEIIKLVHAINGVTPAWELVGFLDDTPAKRGSEFHGFPVLGGGDWLAHLDLHTTRLHNNVAASTRGRRTVSARMVAAGSGFATLIHPTADTAFAEIGPGTSIDKWVSLGAYVQIGEQCAIRQLVVIGHETRVADHVFVGPGVIVTGRVVVGSGAYLGAGCTIRNGVTIGADSVVAAGAVVVEDVRPGARVAGVPAREMASRRGSG